MKCPNIIIFNPDQFRADALAHLGNPASVTPNLDKIQEKDAVSFRYAFCQNPVCTPSRCSFMSGWYPHVRGHRTMHHMMRSDEPVLLKTLMDAGYYVWWGGKNDLVQKHRINQYCSFKNEPKTPLKPAAGAEYRQRRGEPDGDNFYSFYVGQIKTWKDSVNFDSDWHNVTEAVKFIKNPPADQPFCIYLSLTFPHPPYAVEEPWYSTIDRKKVCDRISTPLDWSKKPSILKGIHDRQGLYGWTEERWTELQSTYLGMCARVDYQFGLIIDALKETGSYNDTAVFMFSDHGDFTGNYGLVEKTQNTFEDCLTRVPFIIKPPAGIPLDAGIRDNALVELIDFAATVEDLVGIKPSHTHFGKSLLPLIKNGKGSHRDAVFCEGGRLHGETHCMERESKGSTDSTAPYWPRVSLQSSEGPEHTKAVMVRTMDYKYIYRLYETDELYDLKNDPSELNNRIDDPAMENIIRQMRDRLLMFYLETCDVVPHIADIR
ncbi:MAG: sulfatase-like hydrolase/transferase [Firmicutes bacterium]|nr:sulfatase-like hydrolase/transferase [Bacillota bacterium]